MDPTKVFSVASDSSPGKHYYVAYWPNGATTCTCPSFLFSRQQRGKDVFERSCKHTERVIAGVTATHEESTVPEEVRQILKKRPSDKLSQAEPMEEVEEVDPRLKTLIAATLGKL